MTKNTKPVVEQELAQLEDKVDSLVSLVEQLMKENHSLRAQQDTLATERALSLIHISEPTRLDLASRMPSYA